PTAFNQCRSEVKFLEYASRGVVALCSSLGPYLEVGEPGKSILLFKNCEDLQSKLDYLFMHRGIRDKIVDEARRWVESNRLASGYDWVGRLMQYRKLASGPLEAGAKNLQALRQIAKVKIGGALAAAIDSQSDRLSLLANLEQNYPGHYQVHYFRGWAFSRDGDYQAAIPSLRKGLTHNPESIRTSQLLVRSLILAGKIDEAWVALKDILAIEPDLVTLVTLKGVILQLKKQHREVCGILEPCVRQSPRLVEAKLTYIRSAIELRLFDCAEEQLCELETLIPESPEVWFLRAVMAYQRNNIAATREYLTRGLQFDPTHKQGRMLRRKIEKV
ncbi:MAG: tetratricopeptide repeat protein, partial [bacterium]